MPWIANHKHKIEEKSIKSFQSSSKVVGLELADPWEFPTLGIYPQIHNIRNTKSQNLNVSRLVLPLPLPNPLKPGVKSRMKM